MIDLKTLRTYCASKRGAIEDFPFDEHTLTCKVKNKIFAIIPTDITHEAPRISLKCDPTLAQILRNTYDAVQPGYHLNKKHWNTITVDGSIPLDEIYEMIDNSYDLVVKSLTKAEKMSLTGE